MIREATMEDIHQVVDLVIKDAKARKWEDQSKVEVDKKSLKVMFRYYQKDNSSVILVSEEDKKIVGYFIGTIRKFILNINYNAAHEKISGGSDRHALWETFGQWAKNNKSIIGVHGCYDKLDTPRFRRI